MLLTGGYKSDLGVEYRFRVITYIAANLAQDTRVRNFVIYTKLSTVDVFNDLILKLWFEGGYDPYVFFIKTRHRSCKPININKDIPKYANSFKNLMQNKSKVAILQDVPDVNVKPWFFSNNNIDENVFIYKTTAPFEFLYGSCYQLQSTHFKIHSEFFDKFYLFLDQPNFYQINDRIAKICNVVDPTDIANYVKDYFDEPELFKCGLTKTNFETELLKIRLKNYIVRPTETVEVNENQAEIWNKLTIEHQITVVDDVSDIRGILFGCFVQKINYLFDHTLNWNDCLYNQEKLDNAIIGKFKNFSQNNLFRQWVYSPQNIKSLMECLWICNELPLILKVDGPLPILDKYKHLNKRFLIISENSVGSQDIASCFSRVFTNVADIHTDSLRNELTKSVLISLQGRTPVPLYDAIGSDEDCMKKIKSSQILQLIRKRKMHLDERCLNEAESTIFIIEDEKYQSNKDINKIDADDNDTIIINCNPSESEWYIKHIEGNPVYKHNSICCLRSSRGMLEFLEGDRHALRTFFIDNWGDDIYCVDKKDPVPVIGKRLDNRAQVYIPRHLRKAIISKSIFKTQEKRICLLSGDIDSLDGDIKEQLIEEEIDYNAKTKLENNENVLIADKILSIHEYWNKFSSLDCPLFHVKVVNGCMELLNYRNCTNMSSNILYSKETFKEDAFYKEINSKLTVISGEAGIGKSSLLRSLSEANDERNYVLFCNLADYRSDLTLDNEKLFKAPIDFIFNKFEGALHKKLVHSLYKYHESSGRLIVFIDSFDEVLPMHRKSVLLFVKAVAKFNVRVIVASRLFFDTLLINNFEVQPIEVDSLKEVDYIMYFKNKGMLNMNLNEIPKEFLLTPLFVTFLWFLYREGTLDFTQISKFDIYKKIIMKKIERYYRKSKQIYNPEVAASTNDVLRLHRLIALMVIFGKHVVIQLKIIKDYEKLITEFKVLKMRLGIVKYFDDGYPVFLHQSFAEFLAAEWLCEKFLNDDFDSPAQSIYEKMMLEYDISIRYLFDNMICVHLNLHKAIIEGNLILVRKLVNEDEYNLTQIDKCGRNAILLAASYCFDKNYDILEEVALKSEAYKVDFLKRDCLMKWTWYQCLDVFSKDCFFDQACSYNLPVTVTKYLSYRERSIVSKNILSAYRNGNLDVLLALFAVNSSLLAQHFFSVTKMAIERGRLDIAYDLIELKHNCNLIATFRGVPDPSYLMKFVEIKTGNEFTALHLACMLGSQEIVKKLLCFANVYAKDVFGNIPFHYAIIEGKSEVVMLLRDKMTDMNIKNEVGDTFLHLVCRFLKDELIEFLLLEDKVDVNEKNFKGETPLHAVACKDWQQIIENEVKITSNIIFRPAIKSVDDRERNFNKILMRSRSLTESDRLLRDALHKKVISLIDTILNFGSNITEQDDEGNTAVHLAYKYNNRIVLEYLIEKSNQIAFVKNANGLSVFEIAKRERKSDIVDYIQQRNTKIIQNENMENNSLLSEMEEFSLRRELKYTGQQGRTLLHMATIHGRSDIIQILLEKGFPVDVCDEEGYTPLHLVKSIRDVQLFFKNYSDYKNAFKKSRNGETPLCTACRNGNIDLVKFLLSHNGDVKTRNKYGQTPLHLAAITNNLDVVIVLLERGADVNAFDSNKSTALHLVIPKGRTLLVEFLLKSNANVYLQDTLGNTALHLACRYGYVKIVERLIEKSRDVIFICNAEGYRPYDIACMEGKRDIVDFFIKIFPSKDLSIPSNVLSTIIKMGHLSVLKVLLENCAITEDNLGYKDEEGNTLLHLASLKDHVRIVRVLLEKELKPNLQNNNGETPLHLAKSVECAEMFLLKYKSGIDLHIKTKFDETPLHRAACLNAKLVQTLLDTNGDISSKDSFGWTPLHIATWANKLDVVQILLENDANVNETNNYSGTALHIAATKQLQLFKLLLDYGADINAENKFGELALQRNTNVQSNIDETFFDEAYSNHTVLDIACIYERHDIIEYLLKNNHAVKWSSVSKDALFEAVSRGDLWCLRMLFDEQVISEECLRYVDSNENTLLHIAVMHGYEDIVSFLIGRGAEVNVENKSSMTPLTLAVLKDQTDIINKVLTSHVPLSTKDEDLTLTMAVLKNNVKLVNVLLNANTDSDKNIGILLHLALLNGSAPLLEMLMNSEVDMNIRDADGHTAFEFILVRANYDRIKYLVNKYSRLKKCGVSDDTLFEIVEAGKLMSLQILFDEDILRENALECNNEDGRTLLHLATRLGHSEIIRLLLEKGATAYRCDLHGYTPLHLIKSATDAQLLINTQNLGTLNMKTHGGLTPLHIASRGGYLDVVQMLLSAKADISNQDEHGDTSLHFAAREDRLDVLRFLIQGGANVNAVNNNFETALHIAASKNLVSVFKVLLENGADIGLQDKEKNTALHLACKESYTDVVDLLLRLSNNIIYLKNLDNYTPFQLLCVKGMHAQIKSVLSNSSKPEEIIVSDHTLFEIISRGNSKVLQILFEENILVQTHLEYIDAEGNTTLYVAVANEKVEAVKILLENGANANAINSESITPLHVASSENLLSILEILLDYDADLQLTDNNGNTALHFAVAEDHIDIVRALIERGTNVNALNTDSLTALHIVASENLLSILEMLLNNNANIESSDKNGNTPLHLAVMENHTDIVRALIGKGANINAINIASEAPTHIAASENLLSILEVLMECNANILLADKNGNTALHLAYMEGNVEAIDILTKQDSGMLSLRNFKGYTPFEFACIYGMNDVLKKLLDHVLTTKKENISADTICGVVDLGNLTNLQLILDAGIIKENDLDNTTKCGRFLLHIAALNGHVDIVRFLLDKGVKVNPSDHVGFRPLHFAKSASVAKLLIAGYANAYEMHEKCLSGRTPLHIASGNGYVDVVQLLLSLGAEVSVKDVCGWTPLLLSAYMDHYSSACVLLKYGADVNEMNNCNETALHLSVQNSNWRLVDILLVNGANILFKDWNGNTVLHSLVNIYRWDSRFAESPFYSCKYATSVVINLVNNLLQYGVDPFEFNDDHESAIDIVKYLQLRKMPLLKK